MLSKPLIARLSILSSLVIVGAALNGCGYSPLYGRGATSAGTQGYLSLINVRPIPNRVGQVMHSSLTHLLAPRSNNTAQAYDLSVNLSESLATLAVEKNAFATRANLTLTADYKLTRRTDGYLLTSGSAKSVSSYNILTSNFATLAAKDDSRARVVQDLAETLRTRLAIYFQGPGQKQPALNTKSGRP